MFQKLYAEKRRNRREREEAYDELHPVTPTLERIELMNLAAIGQSPGMLTGHNRLLCLSPSEPDNDDL